MLTAGAPTDQKRVWCPRSAHPVIGLSEGSKPDTLFARSSLAPEYVRSAIDRIELRMRAFAQSTRAVFKVSEQRGPHKQAVFGVDRAYLSVSPLRAGLEGVS